MNSWIVPVGTHRQDDARGLDEIGVLVPRQGEKCLEDVFIGVVSVFENADNLRTFFPVGEWSWMICDVALHRAKRALGLGRASAGVVAYHLEHGHGVLVTSASALDKLGCAIGLG